MQPLRDGTAPRELPPCEIAFVFALGVEAGGLTGMLENVVVTRCASFIEHAGQLQGRDVVVIESGLGMEATAQAVEDLLAMHQPAWVISAGFAASLCEDVRRGHILMPDQLVDEAGETLVDLTITTRNQNGDVVVQGYATARAEG